MTNEDRKRGGPVVLPAGIKEALRDRNWETVDVISVARMLADLNPNYIYPRDVLVGTTGSGCFYRENKDLDRVPCLFGHTLRLLGANMDDVPEGQGIVIIIERLNRSVSYAQETWLATVQHEQDNGKTWSEAIANGDRSVGDYLTPEEGGVKKVHRKEDQ